MINNVTVWLDKTAEKFPDKLAFSDENIAVTFENLRKRAIALAGKIMEKKLFKMPIAVMIEKSVDTLIAFMAVAYSGNFYTVIDTDMPDSRKQKIFEVFNPSLVISSQRHKEIIDNLHIDQKDIIYIEDPLELELQSYEDEVLMQRERCCDTDLLYILFTSGSTGVPKGVTICHRSVVDYIDWVEETFEITEKDTFGNQAPFYFDNSVLDIYTSIKTGATLEIIPRNLFAQPVRLLNYIIEKEINTIFWVPSELVLVANLHALKKVDLTMTLKRVLFAGEVMPAKQLNEWRKYLPGAMYANLYGPTEITVDCTCYIVDREFEDDEPIPIGKPIRNSNVLVLNENNKLVFGDEIGELCVRGTSLSMGYYNNPEKTKEVFIQNPFNHAYQEWIYKTGDLVKYNQYGELVYVSRKDYQIKHMGHRIELGEIENVVSGMRGVDSCCCVYDDKRKKIVLVYEGKLEKEEIIPLLKTSVPEYMMPGKIMSIASMPMNANGKIDRKKIKGLI
ncbi:MAG: amino acid adenylation domain-containing protein [Lachnospiraceae bacterium]|nr:amino acid adenylation domain-containing protein [Lachnospiraceae bacterium]MDY5521448.1 amino acid adenylation domain-containing protein [Agathobacter sp.]